jgi:hypothetical protein
MKNGQLHDDKLFQGLHDRLSDYEAPYDGADWDAMSRELDKLPKSNPFRWKFSLNTIGIVLGIAGLTAIGVVMASGNSKQSATSSEKQEVTASPVVNTAPESSTPTAISTPATHSGPEAIGQSVADHANSNSENESTGKDRKTQKSPFYFPDQIDPVKGFVYTTHEDPALLKDHPDIERPEVYYDIVNGKVTPIIIPKDSIKDRWINTIDTSSAKENKTDDAAPSEGQRQGFGDDRSQTF